MKLKIFSDSVMSHQEVLEKLLIIGGTIAAKGQIPSLNKLKALEDDPHQNVLDFWCRKVTDTSITLYPSTNNYWCAIRFHTKDYFIVDFGKRHENSQDQKSFNSLMTLIAKHTFSCNVEVMEGKNFFERTIKEPFL